MPQCCGCQYGETSMSVGGSERRNAKRPTRRNGRNIEFSADPTRVVPCDAVAIGGKLLQNNGIELCVCRTDAVIQGTRLRHLISIGWNGEARTSALLCGFFFDQCY